MRWWLRWTLAIIVVVLVSLDWRIEVDGVWYPNNPPSRLP